MWQKFLHSTKLKQALTWLFLIFSVLFFVLLIVFKDNLNDYASKAIKAQGGAEIQNSVPAFVDSASNYAKNGLSYEGTFLEFGAKGCSACRRLKSVMDEIQAKYPMHVNVVFVNTITSNT